MVPIRAAPGVPAPHPDPAWPRTIRNRRTPPERSPSTPGELVAMTDTRSSRNGTAGITGDTGYGPDADGWRRVLTWLLGVAWLVGRGIAVPALHVHPGLSAGDHSAHGGRQPRVGARPHRVVRNADVASPHAAQRGPRDPATAHRPRAPVAPDPQDRAGVVGDLGPVSVVDGRGPGRHPDRSGLPCSAAYPAPPCCTS